MVLLGGAAMAVALAGLPEIIDAAKGAMSDHAVISLRGRILPRCTLSGAQTPMSIGAALSSEDTARTRRGFEVNCNAPFVVSMSSAHGGLRIGGSSDGILQYRANLQILTDSGQTLTLDCDGGELGADGTGCRGESGDNTAIGKEAVLTVSWQMPKGIAAGAYADDLSLSFAIKD
jgi:hypothetical protein